MEEILLTVKGRNGQLDLLEERIRICRKGTWAFISQGLKGHKEIRYADITAIQFKQPDRITVGYIQFSIPGGVESKKGLFSATSDENTVLFTPKQQKDFEFAKGEIDRRIAHARRPASGRAAGLLELEKLAHLKEKGILSEEEFNSQKQQILTQSDELDATAVRAYRDTLNQKWQAQERCWAWFWNITGSVVGLGIIVMASSALPKHPPIAISMGLLGLIPTPVLSWLTQRLGMQPPGFWLRLLLFLVGFIVFGILFGR